MNENVMEFNKSNNGNQPNISQPPAKEDSKNVFKNTWNFYKSEQVMQIGIPFLFFYCVGIMTIMESMGNTVVLILSLAFACATYILQHHFLNEKLNYFYYNSSAKPDKDGLVKINMRLSNAKKEPQVDDFVTITDYDEGCDAIVVKTGVKGFELLAKNDFDALSEEEQAELISKETKHGVEYYKMPTTHILVQPLLGTSRKIPWQKV